MPMVQALPQGGAAMFTISTPGCRTWAPPASCGQRGFARCVWIHRKTDRISLVSRSEPQLLPIWQQPVWQCQTGVGKNDGQASDLWLLYTVFCLWGTKLYCLVVVLFCNALHMHIQFFIPQELLCNFAKFEDFSLWHTM